MKRALLAVAIVGCGGGISPTDSSDDDTDIDAPVQTVGCPGGVQSKIKFAEDSSCANDGSVEFCIPEANAALRATLTAISPAINCAQGGGRANCNASPGLLLCFYPTRFPDECEASHGAMKAEVWSDMCEIAEQPEVSEIVATFFE
jgi:hypothetical protein